MKFSKEKDSLEIGSVASRMGRKTIIAENISKSFDGVKYIDDFSYIILKHDRIGIIGPNGCGKSTLVNMLTGNLEPDSGKVECGETIKIGLFSQHNETMDPAQRVIDYIRDTAEYVLTTEGRISASQMLEKFLFNPSMQYLSLIHILFSLHCYAAVYTEHFACYIFCCGKISDSFSHIFRFAHLS